MIETNLNTKTKCLQLDWGTEFRLVTSYLATQGIQFRHPCPYIHHKNEIIECKHRHIMKT